MNNMYLTAEDIKDYVSSFNLVMGVTPQGSIMVIQRVDGFYTFYKGAYFIMATSDIDGIVSEFMRGTNPASWLVIRHDH